LQANDIVSHVNFATYKASDITCKLVILYHMKSSDTLPHEN